jgi:hypothetical protein
MSTTAMNEERKGWKLAPEDYRTLEPDWRRSMLRLQQWAQQHGYHELAASCAYRIDLEAAKASGKYDVGRKVIESN